MRSRGLTDSPTFEVLVRGQSIKRIVRPQAVVKVKIPVDERVQSGDGHGGLLDIIRRQIKAARRKGHLQAEVPPPDDRPLAEIWEEGGRLLVSAGAPFPVYPKGMCQESSAVSSSGLPGLWSWPPGAGHRQFGINGGRRSSVCLQTGHRQGLRLLLRACCPCCGRPPPVGRLRLHSSARPQPPPLAVSIKILSPGSTMRSLTNAWRSDFPELRTTVRLLVPPSPPPFSPHTGCRWQL